MKEGRNKNERKKERAKKKKKTVDSQDIKTKSKYIKMKKNETTIYLEKENKKN